MTDDTEGSTLYAESCAEGEADISKRKVQWLLALAELAADGIADTRTRHTVSHHIVKARRAIRKDSALRVRPLRRKSLTWAEAEKLVPELKEYFAARPTEDSASDVFALWQEVGYQLGGYSLVGIVDNGKKLIFEG